MRVSIQGAGFLHFLEALSGAFQFLGTQWTSMYVVFLGLSDDVKGASDFSPYH